MADVEAERQAKRDAVAAAICKTITDKAWADVKKYGHVTFVQKMFQAADAAIKAYTAVPTNSVDRERVPF
jgi:hypothetical protein